MEQEERIYSFYSIDKNTAAILLSTFDKSLTADVITPIHSGMSTSNYCITAGHRKYLLKLYSGGTRNIEPGMYAYLGERIRVPSLHYYDGSRKLCPFPYAIIEYINGQTLSEYVRAIGEYPSEIVREIGMMLSVIHQKRYPQSGHLSRELELIDSGMNTPELISVLLAGKAGARLSNIIRDKLQKYIKQNHSIFERIDCDFVLCHGDMSYGNILISDDVIYLIDFEYALVESRFRDIGKFFRTKAPDVQCYINEGVYKAFFDGYGELPSDWLRLAKLADIPVMLGLLNVEAAPQEWVTDIEHDIMEAIR